MGNYGSNGGLGDDGVGLEEEDMPPAEVYKLLTLFKMKQSERLHDVGAQGSEVSEVGRSIQLSS